MKVQQLAYIKEIVKKNNTRNIPRQLVSSFCFRRCSIFKHSSQKLLGFVETNLKEIFYGGSSRSLKLLLIFQSRDWSFVNMFWHPPPLKKIATSYRTSWNLKKLFILYVYFHLQLIMEVNNVSHNMLL